MSFQVVIFSLDELRGGIIREILQRTRLKARLYNRATIAKMAITEYNPRVVILDIKGCMASEIRILANSIQNLDSTQIIALGDPSVMETIEGPGIPPLKFLIYIWIFGILMFTGSTLKRSIKPCWSRVCCMNGI